MTEKFAKLHPAAMDQFLKQMNEKAEKVLKEYCVGRTYDGEPWSQELFDVTMQVIVDVTIANADVVDFNFSTSIENHILFMNVQDQYGNTICDLAYTITYHGDEKKPNGYTVDHVQVAFKTGPFVAPKENPEDPDDQLPF